jgi:hypothetical protein
MDGRGKVYLSVFLENDNMKVIGAIEVKNQTFSNLVISGIQWSHSRIKFFSFGKGPLTPFPRSLRGTLGPV